MLTNATSAGKTKQFIQFFFPMLIFSWDVPLKLAEGLDGVHVYQYHQMHSTFAQAIKELIGNEEKKQQQNTIGRDKSIARFFFVEKRWIRI